MRTVIPPVLLLVMLTIFSTNSAKGQKQEVGLLIGSSYYLGDLNPYMHFAMANFAGGAMYRRNFTENISARVNFLYGKVEADDAVINYNPGRNLHFKSTIMELSLQAEINFVPFITGDIDTPYSFYLFAGGGAFRFNPKAQHNGQWHELRPLGTEGQNSDMYPDRKAYSLYSYNLLFGVGMKFYISESIGAGIEWGMRRTATDYLDDVSTTYPDPDALSGFAQNFSDRSIGQTNQPGMQRGNPYNNDWYSFAGVTISIRIKNPSKLRCHAY